MNNEGPLFVVAGTYGQFQDWLMRTKMKAQHVVYAHKIEDILGYPKGTYLLIGTWADHDENSGLLRELHLRGNQKVFDDE